MSTQYPANFDSFNNPGPTDQEDASGLEHDLQHANANDAIAALETKLGKTNDPNVNSVDYFIKNFFKKGTVNPVADPGLPTAFFLNTATKTLFMWDGTTWN